MLEAISVLIGLAVLGWLLVSPILTFTLMGRVRRLEDALARLRARLPVAPLEEPGKVPRPHADRPRTDRPAAKVAPLDIWLAEEDPRGKHEAKPPVVKPSAAPVAASGPNVPEQPRTPSEADHFSWEELLAGKWLTWVGAVALVFGAGFFLKYAIDNDLIGERGRLAIGFVVGMACYAGGAYAVLRRYDWLGQGLIGAALGILYFTLFAGFRFYHGLIPQNIAFAGMIAVTASSLAFSAKFDAPATAVLGLIGGFATPLMLSTGVDERWVLFPYLFVLNAGVLGISSFRRWQLLQGLAFIGTLVIWLGWFDEYYEPSKLADVLILMTSHFVLFALMAIWHNVWRRIPAQPGDFFLMLATPIVYFAGLYGVTLADYDDWHGLLAVGMAAIYLALGVVGYLRYPAGRRIVLALAGVAVSFLTLAIPLQFTGHWVAIAWAAESVVLFELGLRFHEPKLQRAGFGVLGIVLVILVFYATSTVTNPETFSTRFTQVDPVVQDVMPRDVMPSEPGPSTRNRNVSDTERFEEVPDWTDVFNGRSFSFLAAVLAMGIMAWESRRRDEAELEERESSESPGLSTNAGLATLAGVPLVFLGLLLLETFSYSVRADWLDVTFLGVASVWTAAVALVTLAWSTRRHNGDLAVIGIGMFALLALFLLVGAGETFDGWRGQWRRLNDSGAPISYWWWMLANPRGIGFLAALISAACGAFLVHRAGRDIGENSPLAGDAVAAWSKRIPALLGCYAYVTAWLMFTVEVYAQGVMRDWRTGTALAITATWTVYAIVTLIVGIQRRSGLMRLMALILFFLTAGKVFLYDVWHLDEAIRTFAFVSLGVGLLLASWMYRRFRDRIRSWITPALLFALIPAGTLVLPSAAEAQESTARASHTHEQAVELLESLPWRWPIDRNSGDDLLPGELVAIRILPDLYGTARHDLGDVRILSITRDSKTARAANPVEIPYVIVRPRDVERSLVRSVRMRNLARGDGTTEFLLVRETPASPANRLTIDIADTERDYRRIVKVYGSHGPEPEEWKLLTDEGHILGITLPEHRFTLETVDFPTTTFERLRVVIVDGDDEPLAIAGVRLHLHESKRAERTAYPCRIVSQETTAADHETRVILDTGYDALPTVGLDPSIRYEANFSRHVIVETPRSPVDDPSHAVWRRVSGGTLLRIERPGLEGSEFHTEETKLEFAETPARFFRLTISNGDDRPLRIEKCAALSVDRFLVVEGNDLAADGIPAVYAGASRLDPPAYDLARTIGEIEIDDLPRRHTSQRAANALSTGRLPPDIPWSERNATLLWGATVAGIVVLGFGAFLLLRRAAAFDDTGA